MEILLGTYTRAESQGIYTLNCHVGDEQCYDYNLFHKIENPTYLDLYHDYVFSVCSKNDRGGVALFKNGTLVNQVLNQKVAPCYVSYDPYHQLLYSANYHQGMINSYKFVNGHLEAHETIQFESGSKAHFVQYLKAFNIIFVCDLGLDKAYILSIDDKNHLTLKQTLEFDLGSGPRHVVAHPNKPYLYVLSELSYEIFIVHFDQDFKVIKKLPANPTMHTKNQHGAAIKLSKDGKYLYTSNRNDDSLSVFKLVEPDKLELIQHISTYGEHPRDFEISPDQNYVVAANLRSNNCTFYRRNTYNGKLELLEKNVAAYEPVCVRFKK